LAIYLLTERSWNEASIGLVMSMAAIAGLVAQGPAGALIDRSRAKRGIVIAAAILVTVSSLSLPWLASFWPIATLQAAAHVAAAIFAPAVAAISLGLVGAQAFARRVGRNEAFNHAGNAVAAGMAALAAWRFGPVAVFWIMGGMAILSILAALWIPADRIDHAAARGGASETQPDAQVSGLSVLLTCRPLLVFAASTTAFHLANAAMLPLVGQKLALANKEVGTSLISICIVAAQVVMVPVAALVGARADRWGRKPIFLAGFAVLALRGALYPLSDSPFWLVGVQLLDGVGAGIFGALFPLVVSDLMAGTGRFNVAQGAVATAQGIGAALSTGLAGAIVVRAGYSAAFLTLAAIAAFGFGLFWLMMPETARTSTSEAEPTGTAPVRPAPIGLPAAGS
ncbi:MAG: MFS transporter, partial [Methylobacteriaceae bacterium]|nr:MFS transporter [Methylobacteriaceae bacterium]